MDRICPKHVEFYSKNKFEKLVHLVGFIVRIYHYARSSEYQIRVQYSDIIQNLCTWFFHYEFLSMLEVPEEDKQNKYWSTYA
jgi:hypothetical protein